MAASKKTGSSDSAQMDNRKQKRVSDTLRDGRLAIDQELKDVSENLRIRLPFLEAIETGQYQDLPGTTYAIGFVRGYADYLGLDSDKLVEQFKIEAEELERRTELHFPEPLPGGSVPGGAIVFICVILAVIFYGGWVLVSSNGKPIAEVVSEIPANLAELIGVDTNQTEDGMDAEIATDLAPDEPDDSAAETIVETVIETAEEGAEETAEAANGVAEEAVVIASDALEGEAQEAQEEMAEVVADTTTNDVDEPEITDAAESAEESIPADMASTEGDVSDVIEEVVEDAVDATETSESAVEETVDTVVNETSDSSEVVADVTAAGEETGEAISDAVTVEPVETAQSIVSETLAADTEEISSNIVAADPIPSPPVLPQVERTPRVYGEENVNSRIIITAKTPTWVEVTAPSGELMLTRLLAKDDSYRVPDTKGLTLVTGNAGGLDFTVDGQLVPAIGPVGSVRRDVLLEAESLKKGPE